ncbi:MAG: protein kinase [Desulfurococcaceae archaeon]
MREFRIHSDIDHLSRELNDPVNLAQILLKQKMIAVNRKSSFTEFVSELKTRSIDLLKKKSILYLVVKHIDDKWIIRGLLAGSLIISIYFEDNVSGIKLLGSNAYEQVVKNIQIENPVIKYSIGSILFEDLPESIKGIVQNVIETALSIQPPSIWLNKYLYDMYIEKSISDKGGYVYVLLGRDRIGRRYAVKIPREKTIDGKPLAVGSNSTTIAEVFKGFVNCLEVSQMTREDLKRGLNLLGYDESYVDEIIVYKKYILKPRAIIMFRDVYSLEEYFETPPVVIEDYADRGDLDSKVRIKPLDERELVYISVRLAGALSLIHIARLLHMDIKPQNILLISDEYEPYGYAPLISDLVGSPHVYDKNIDLKKSTPEYAEPFSLITGKVDFSYDTYSLGVTLFYTATGRRLIGRMFVNILTLKEIYGVQVPIKSFLIDYPDLTKYYNSVERLLKDYRNKNISIQELLDSINNIVQEIDGESLTHIYKLLSNEVSSIIIKSISLDKATRYSDAVLLWRDFIEAIKEKGYLNLIPSKTI